MIEIDLSVEQIAIAMLDQMGALRKLVANLSESLVAMNSMIEHHTKVLAGHQRVVEVIAGELGIPLQGVDPVALQSPPPLN
jgi:hypothetical protein